MLEGWYCKALANDQNGSNAEVQSDEEVNQNQAQELHTERDYYKTEYQNLKKKLKFLLYENEFFQDSLKASQRRLLKVTRDRSYLLDRLLQYEKADCSSTESEDTESSDEEIIKTEGKKRKLESGQNVMKTATKKKRVGAPKKQQMMQSTSVLHQVIPGTGQEEGLTTEEVLHHLQSRQSLHEMIPSVPPPIVPTEMFSNEPSSESNEMIENLGDDLFV